MEGSTIQLRGAPAVALSGVSERALFLAVVMLMTVPVWLFTYYPATDGPVHLNIATIMNDYGEPSASRIREYFRFNNTIEPNVVAHHVIAALDRVFGILVAEKIFLTFWVVLFCASARMVVLAVNPGAAAISYLFLPTTFNYFTHDGYYNFILGMALCFLVLGLWYARRDRLTWWHLALLGASGIAIVWTHLFSFLMLIFLIGLVTTFDYGLRAWTGRRAERAALGRLAVDYVRRAAVLLLTFAPAMYFTFSFVLRHGLTEAAPHEQDKLSLLMHLVGMSYLFSFDKLEVLFFAPYLILVAGLGALLIAQRVRRRRLTPADAFLFCLLCIVAVYLFVPITTKEVAISQRFLGYILAVGIFWLASVTLPRRAANGLVTAMIVLVAVITVYRGWKYEAYNEKLDVYVAAAQHIEPNSTILALHYWKQRQPLLGEQITWRTDPFRHGSSYIAMLTNGVDLRSSMMAPSVYGYFPVVYRRDLDPYVVVGDIEALPPEANLAGYSEQAGEAIDYVLLWADDGSTDSIHRQLSQGYELIHASADGLVQLFRLRDGGS